eukprot:2566163-Ditylum_brightwellii.AAC.1
MEATENKRLQSPRSMQEILMMGDTNDPVDAAQRNLVAGNPKGRENYCETLQTQFTQHKIFTK